MDNNGIVDKDTPAEEPEDGLSGETAQRKSPEWSGGHEGDSPSGPDADPEDLPEHELEEGTTVSPENS